MSTPRFVTKIVGGKLVTVPVFGDPLSSSLSQHSHVSGTYPWGRYDPILAEKIGSRSYRVLPPIKSDCSELVTHDKLAQRVTDALSTVNKQKLQTVKHKFALLDKDHSGRITSEELRQVLLVYQIFILGPTLEELVKKFEAKGGGVFHEPLAKYLLECHSLKWHDKGKLSSAGLSTPLSSNLVNNSYSSKKGADAQLLLEVENQLMKADNRWDYAKLKMSFLESDQGKSRSETGFIESKEMKMLCKRHVLPVNRSLLEKLLARFDTERDGWINWREFSKFFEKALAVVSLGNSLRSGSHISGERNKRQSVVKKQNSTSTVVSTETQTSSGKISCDKQSQLQTQNHKEPEPVQLSIRGRKIYLYPPDKYLDLDVSPDPPEEQLELEWVYGYRGSDCRNNLFVLKSGEIVYFTAAVVVLYHLPSHSQRHYTEHTDDIKSLTVHPDGVTVASGQVKGHGKDCEPHIRIWNSENLQTVCVLGRDYFEDAVYALAFSCKRSHDVYLASVEDNEYHTVTIWDWQRKKKLASARGSMDQVLAVRFSPFQSRQFVTCGKQHVSFWEMEDGRLKLLRGRFDKQHRPKYVSCVTFSSNGDAITGDTDGSISVWPEDSNQIAEDLGVRNAHSGPVYTLLALPNNVLLSGGGGESTVRAWSRRSRLVPTNVELKMPRDVRGVRTLALCDSDQLFIGTVDNSIWYTELAFGSDSPLMGAGARLKKIVEGHTQDLYGLATHPSSPLFVTGGSEKVVRLWNAIDRRVVWTNNKLSSSVQAAAFHPGGSFIAVGFKNGGWMLLNSLSGDIMMRKSEPSEKISEMQFSPDGSLVALASHDNDIHVFELQNEGKTVSLKSRCKGHSSSVKHVDWSKDSEALQSTSSDYELLFWDPQQGEQIVKSESMRNTEWATHNCVLGYTVIGVWPDGADGTDVNSVDCAKGKHLLASGDDFGDVNLYRYPCISKKAQPRKAFGHSAHVMNVRFLYDDSRLISVGGRDASVMQWKISKSV